MKYFPFLLLILLFNRSNENFDLEKRIENSVKYMFSIIENIMYQSSSFTLKYQKYKIIFSKIRVISPIIDNIVNYEYDINTLIYTVNNISFSFLFDLDLYFKDNDKNQINKKDNYIEATFSFIKFKYDLNNDFLNFVSFDNIDSTSNIININSDLGYLDYFKDFNNNKLCLCKKGKGEYIEENPKIFIYNILKEYLKYYFEKLLGLNLLLIYDSVTIFNRTLNKLECSKVTKLTYKIDYLKVNRIMIPYKEIDIQSNFKKKLWIRQIKYYGVYYSLEYNQEINFQFDFDGEKENDISVMNGKLLFVLDNLLLHCEFFNKHPEEEERLRYALKYDYGNYLKETTNNYYNNN